MNQCYRALEVHYVFLKFDIDLIVFFIFTKHKLYFIEMLVLYSRSLMYRFGMVLFNVLLVRLLFFEDYVIRCFEPTAMEAFHPLLTFSISCITLEHNCF